MIHSYPVSFSFFHLFNVFLSKIAPACSIVGCSTSLLFCFLGVRVKSGLGNIGLKDEEMLSPDVAKDMKSVEKCK